MHCNVIPLVVVARALFRHNKSEFLECSSRNLYGARKRPSLLFRVSFSCRPRWTEVSGSRSSRSSNAWKFIGEDRHPSAALPWCMYPYHPLHLQWSSLTHHSKSSSSSSRSRSPVKKSPRSKSPAKSKSKSPSKSRSRSRSSSSSRSRSRSSSSSSSRSRSRSASKYVHIIYLNCTFTRHPILFCLETVSIWFNYIKIFFVIFICLKYFEIKFFFFSPIFFLSYHFTSYNIYFNFFLVSIIFTMDHPLTRGSPHKGTIFSYYFIQVIIFLFYLLLLFFSIYFIIIV